MVVKAEERDFVMQLTRRAPAIQTLQSLAQDFLDSRDMRERVEPAFDGWFKCVQTNGINELKSFAEGLLTDEPAVHAAFSASGVMSKPKGNATA
jgi:hypothetical protein